MGRDSVRKAWIWLQPMFSFQRYSSVHYGKQQDTELTEMGGDKASLPFSFSLIAGRKEKPLTNENVNLLEERTSNSDIISENGTSSEPGKRRWIEGVYLCAKASTVVLLLHLVFVAVAVGLSSRYPGKRSFANGSVIYDGSCILTKRWSIALHLIINILSTCILGASNYCMQTLVAPTRESIDQAHAQRRWLDIGCASLRNLFAIDRSRLALWVVLMITATPFHLLYNSMIFESINTNEFGYIVAPHDISPANVWNLTTPELNQCFVYPNYRIWGEMKWPDFATIIAQEKYDHITTGECMSYFNQINQRGIKALIALTPDLSVHDGGNDVIRSVHTLQGVPSSMSTGGSDAVDYGPKGDAAHGNVIQGNSYSTDYITLHLDDGLFYYPYNMSSVEDCIDEGGKRAACAHASKVMDWVNGASAKTIEDVRSYIDAHDIQDVKAERATVCGESNDWGTYTVDGCMAVRAEQHCRLLYSPPICIVIALTTLVKVIAMFLASRIARLQSAPLLTVGDTIASFIANPDRSTAGMCWISSADVHKGKWKKLSPPHPISAEGVLDDSCEAVIITHKPLPSRKRWIQAPSISRISVTIILCLALIAAGASLFQRAITSDWQAYTSNSFLNIALLREWWAEMDANTYNFVHSSGLQLPILSSVVIANIPQLALTICYYWYNSVLTGMVAAAEYSTYGASRQPLRVTWPVKGSKQRSTYWLSIPYQYAIPILMVYTILHWLISQSIFYVTLVPYRPGGQVDWGSSRLESPNAQPSGYVTANPNSAYGGSGGQTVNSLAYSPLPLFVALMVGALMVLILVGLSFRKFKSDMPLAATCSAALSAACHLPEDDDLDNAALGGLMWGETAGSPAWKKDREIDDEKGHCCFTSLEVDKPSATKLYA